MVRLRCNFYAFFSYSHYVFVLIKSKNSLFTLQLILMEVYLPISLGCRAHQRTSVLSEGQVARGCNSRNYMSRGLVGVA